MIIKSKSRSKSENQNKRRKEYSRKVLVTKKKESLRESRCCL